MEVNKPSELILSRLRPYWHKHDCIAWDAASWSTGYAAWRKGLIYYGALQVEDKKATPLERVAFMNRSAKALMRELFPHQDVSVFLEMGVANSISGGLLLGAVRGALIGACENSNSFQEISNSSWKSTLAVRARDSVNQKREALETLQAWHGFEIDATWCEVKREFTFDKSDALGILTHALTTINYEE